MHLWVQLLSTMTSFICKLVNVMNLCFLSIKPVSTPPLKSLLLFASLTCTLTNSSDPAGNHRNLLATCHPPHLSHLLFLTPTNTERGREKGLIQTCVVLLCSLPSTRRQECERAARHHTEAPLKNTCIPLLIIYWWPLLPLWLWGESPPLPPALQWPWSVTPRVCKGCPRNCMFPLI